MSNIKGNFVYCVLYNYSDCNYTIINIKDNLLDAYNYICIQETLQPSDCTIININSIEELYKNVNNNCLNVCYIKTNKYNVFSLYECENVSNYIIVRLMIN